jgi:hypothetical protein
MPSSYRLGAGGALLAGLAIMAASGCDGGGEQELRGADKVTICHATSSASNPFVSNRPNADGTVQGHDGHPNDIIPPFEYIDNNGVTQQYPGKNWDAEGQEIYNNGCEAAPPPTDAPATLPPPTEPAPTEPAPTAPPTDAPETSGAPDTTDGGEVTPTSGGSDTTEPPPTDPLVPDTSEPDSGETTVPDGTLIPSASTTTVGPNGSTSTTTSDGGVAPIVPTTQGGELSGQGGATTTVPGQPPAGETTTTLTGLAADGSTPGTIPATGRSTTPSLALALVLLVVGAIAVLIARRSDHGAADE